MENNIDAVVEPVIAAVRIRTEVQGVGAFFGDLAVLAIVVAHAGREPIIIGNAYAVSRVNNLELSVNSKSEELEDILFALSLVVLIELIIGVE